jgi:hypothetical protein
VLQNSWLVTLLGFDEARLSLDREHILLHSQFDRVRIDAGQIDMDEELIAAPLGIHRDASGNRWSCFGTVGRPG